MQNLYADIDQEDDSYQNLQNSLSRTKENAQKLMAQHHNAPLGSMPKVIPKKQIPPKVIPSKQIAHKEENKTPLKSLKFCHEEAFEPLPGTFEEEMFTFLNKIRTNPKVLVAELQIEMKNNKAPAKTKLLQECIAFMNKKQPVATLKWSQFIQAACIEHTRDVCPKNSFSSTGSNGSSGKERINKYGVLYQPHADLIQGQSNATPKKVIIALMLGEKDPKKAQRNNLLSPHFQAVGISSAPFGTGNMTFSIISMAASVVSKEEAFAWKADLKHDCLITDPSLFPNEEYPPKPSSLEREIFDYQNKARTNPSYIIKRLELKLKLNTTNDPTNIPTVKEAIAELKTIQPMQPLIWSNQLQQAALIHAKDIGPRGVLEHVGSDGSTLVNRINKFGKVHGVMKENLQGGYSNAEDIILSLIVDHNVPSRGHRKTIFDNKLKRGGLITGPHKKFGICTVLEYATDIV